MNEFEGIHFASSSLNLLDKSYGGHVLQDMGMATTNKYISLGCVVLMWIGLQILAFLLLLFLNKEKR